MDYNCQRNVSLDTLRSVYEFYNSFSFLVAKELTFTVAPGRCTDIQDVKKYIMTTVVNRIKHSKPVAYILTRENHENGWPHIHGIGWWPKDRDNSLTLTEGRIFLEEHWKGMKYPTRGYYYNELGRVRVDPLRSESYTQIKDREEIVWKDWLEYICKDQQVKWRVGNAVVRSDLDISKFFSKVETETSDIVD